MIPFTSVQLCTSHQLLSPYSDTEHFNNSFTRHFHCIWSFQNGTSGKEPTCQCRRLRDAGSIPGSGRCPGGRHGNPLQHSYLENPMDRGAWQATVHKVAKSYIWLKQLNVHACILAVRNFCVKIYAIKLIAYGERCQIHDLRRRFSFRTRDQTWSLKSFSIAEFY